MLKQKNRLVVLKLCTILVFLGYAYQYLFFSAPFRAVLWDESLLKPIVESVFKTPWEKYATSLVVDKWIQTAIKINGFFFTLAALASFRISIPFDKKILRVIIFIGGLLLLLLAYLTLKERFFQHGQFFEHAIQVGLPFTLLYAIKTNFSMAKLTRILKILVSLTFISHGLYAVGIYPIPGHFIDMFISNLKVTEDTAVISLMVAGFLDILVAILIFIPKVSKYALIYAFLWGTITSIARITSNFDANFISSSLHQTIYLTVYRLPHGLVPLFVYFINGNSHKNL